MSCLCHHAQSRGDISVFVVCNEGRNVDCPHELDGYDPSYIREVHIYVGKGFMYKV